MFASWLGPQEIILGLFCLFVLVPVIVLAIVLPRVLKRRAAVESDDATPLQRAQRAAAMLTPEDREYLRRWLEPPTAGGDKGITP